MNFCFYPDHQYACENVAHCPHLGGAALADDSSQADADRSRLSQVERATILATLEECDNNRTHAAKKLGISRRALIYKLRDIEAAEDHPSSREQL